MELDPAKPGSFERGHVELPTVAPAFNGGTRQIVSNPPPFQVAVRTLEVTGRLHEWVSLLGALTLFTWVVVQPNWIRFAGACGFSVMALALLVWRRGRGGV